MLNILFIYAREEPEVMYKQGMHELLAPLVHTFYQEYMLVKNIGSSDQWVVRLWNWAFYLL